MPNIPENAEKYTRIVNNHEELCELLSKGLTAATMDTHVTFSTG